MASVPGNVPLTLAIVLGAGQGTRVGGERNKVLLPVGGKPMLVHALEAFARTPEVDEIVLVAHPREVVLCHDDIVQRYGLAKVSAVLAGGATRHQSETRALDFLRPRIEAGEIGTVLIHDGARPFITPGEIAAVIAAARMTGAAILASHVELDETLLELAPEGVVRAAAPVSDLVHAQTPQGFAANLLLEAYDTARAADFEGTDTAASVERLGRPIAVVLGGEDNLKITTAVDLVRAEALFAAGSHPE